MLIFREFSKTQSDQNIHQNAPNCTTFQNFLRACIHVKYRITLHNSSLVYAPELPSICVQLKLICISV